MSRENISDISEDDYGVKPAKLLQYPDKVRSVRKETAKNLKDLSFYTLNYLASGKSFSGKDLALGSNQFIKTNGMCDAETSDPVCKSRPKYTYIRNIPTGTIPPLNISFYNATGCNLEGLTEGRGLVPGLVEDIYDINPIELGAGITGSGNLGDSTCKHMTLPVGSRIYDKKKNGTHWNWETRCTTGHNTMTETTDAALNTQIRLRNRHIPHARMPGPLQLRENFHQLDESDTIHLERAALALLIVLCIGRHINFF